jgi:predicted ABC-type ATPase
MAPPPAKPTAPKLQDRPHVERGDEIYFRDSKGAPWTGSVICHGEHGCTVKLSGGKQHKVRWEGVLGHRRRTQPSLSIVDQGEDGFVAKNNGSGELRYIHDPLSEDDGEDEPMAKALPPANALERLMALRVAYESPLDKALKNAPGLSLKAVTDKRGHQTKRWSKTAPDAPKERPQAKPEAAAAAGPPPGHHDAKAGDTVHFEAGEFKGSGKIRAVGAKGATVVDGKGRDHKVTWGEVSARTPPKPGPKLVLPGKGEESAPADAEKPANKKPAKAPKAGGGGVVPPEKFSAAEYAKRHDDANVTPESILAQFPPDTAEKIRAVEEKLESTLQTIDSVKANGTYSLERQELHRKILYDGITAKVRNEDTGALEEKHFPGLLSPDSVKAATPPEGEKPTFTMLGGRGGSGKSWFSNKAKGGFVDKDKAIFLDNDHIKSLLPEYDGWNAAKVHEEASDLFDDVTAIARQLGVNVVHDATMKTGHKAVALLEKFKAQGYRIEAHYMHLPRQEAAKRAMDRFLGKTQRYVPTDVVLGMTTNEDSFDKVRPHADAWSFRDNNVARGEAPKLISESARND